MEPSQDLVDRMTKSLDIIARPSMLDDLLKQGKLLSTVMADYCGISKDEVTYKCVQYVCYDAVKNYFVDTLTEWQRPVLYSDNEYRALLREQYGWNPEYERALSQRKLRNPVTSSKE